MQQGSGLDSVYYSPHARPVCRIHDWRDPTEIADDDLRAAFTLDDRERQAILGRVFFYAVVLVLAAGIDVYRHGLSRFLALPDKLARLARNESPARRRDTVRGSGPLLLLESRIWRSVVFDDHLQLHSVWAGGEKRRGGRLGASVESADTCVWNRHRAGYASP